jgi:hypothetical protein
MRTKCEEQTHSIFSGKKCIFCKSEEKIEAQIREELPKIFENLRINSDKYFEEKTSHLPEEIKSKINLYMLSYDLKSKPRKRDGKIGSYIELKKSMQSEFEERNLTIDNLIERLII